MFATPQANAHDMWIEPAQFHAEPGAVVSITLHVGHDGDSQRVPRDPRYFERFDLVSARGVTPVPGLDGSPTAGFVRLDAAGAYTLVYVPREAFLELDAEHFEGYLAEEGLEQVIDERSVLGESELPGRERYTRAMKALLTAGAAPTVPQDVALGLPFELVVDAAEADGGRFRTTVRARVDGAPAADVLIEAVRLETGRVAMGARTGNDGCARFDLASGRWMLAAVYMDRDPSERADWKSIWSATTFELPAVRSTARATPSRPPRLSSALATSRRGCAGGSARCRR